MPKKILVVDDDSNICEVLRLYLTFEGYEIYLAGDGAAALDAYKACTPDLVILDLMLPVKSGWEVCRDIRRSSDTPVIMLTAKDTTEDKVVGFELGADDYVVKPFDPKEVVARVKALIRRAGQAESVALPTLYEAGWLTANLATYEVFVQEELVELKPKELQLLFFFLENRNVVFSRDQLLERVWGYDYSGETRTVDVHIKRLRTKLERPGSRFRFKTIWGVGYKFEVAP